MAEKNSLIISILLPLITPVLGLALLVSGVYYYRHSVDVSMRTIAIAAIISGIIVILIAILVLSGIAIYTTTSSSIEDYPGVMPNPPNKTIQ